MPADMVDEHRIDFHRELEQIDANVRQLYGLVIEGIAAATEAFLSGDRDAAKVLRDQDRLVDQLYRDIEELVQRQFALQAPVARDMRYLLTVLRTVPELERSADLAEHIAQRGGQGLAAEVTPRIRGLVQRMSTVAGEMWRALSEAWSAQRAEPVADLRTEDDELDDLHAALEAELASGQVRLPVAMQMTLVSRFYERLGDHAVNIASRVIYLVTGENA